MHTKAQLYVKAKLQYKEGSYMCASTGKIKERGNKTPTVHKKAMGDYADVPPDFFYIANAICCIKYI